MITDSLKKETKTLTERGLHDRSHFTAHFTDGSSINEAEYNWSDVSTETVVDFFGRKKTVMLSAHPVSKIVMEHEGLHTELDVPEGHQVYQAVRGGTSFVPGQDAPAVILGRIVGIVKDATVVEERFLDGMSNQVLGLK